jgi:hypothetical protein
LGHQHQPGRLQGQQLSGDRGDLLPVAHEDPVQSGIVQEKDFALQVSRAVAEDLGGGADQLNRPLHDDWIPGRVVEQAVGVTAQR